VGSLAEDAVKILVLDDEISLAELIAQRLESRGHKAVTAYRGGEAAAMIRTHQPDAMLCDQFLPDVSGIQLLQRIRQESPALPVIMMTGALTESLEESAREAGVEAVLEKPVDFKVLSGLLDAIAGRNDSKGPTAPLTPQQAGTPAAMGLKEALDQAAKCLKKNLILDALARCNGNRREASQLLKIDAKTLYNMTRELGIRPVTVFKGRGA
jgi:DNA-binding NtrC family response regulator